MKKIVTVLIFTAFAVSCNNAGGGSSSAIVGGSLDNDDQKAAYAYGMTIGSQVKQQFEMGMDEELNVSELERGVNDYIKSAEGKRNSYAIGQNIGQSVDGFIKSQGLEGQMDPKLVLKGLSDVINDKDVLIPEETIMDFMNNYLMSISDKNKSENLEKGEKFMDEKKKSDKVKVTESGLAYEIIKEGEGSSPTEESVVEVNYTGKNVEGVIFDESKGTPVKFPLTGVIQGWQEGLKLMKPGAKYKFYIPSDLAYGDRGAPGGKIQPGETLEFEVELISVE